MTDAEGSAADDDQKARFREALERKNKTSHPTSGGGAKGSPGAHGEHGAEATKREFRRKSGG